MWKRSILLGVALVGLAAVAAAQETTSCTRCHSDPDLFDEESIAIVTSHAESVHSKAGISCHHCHGGNPDPSLAADLDAAMSEDYEPNPYHGSPAVQDIPAFCGRCHSDADYMKRFRPDIVTDQESQYRTSHHGEALAQGDTNVATCVSCHGVHDIVSPQDERSPVHATNVAATCGHCHSDKERMASYQLSSGEPLPTNQQALWRSSVHAAAMYDRGDLSAPTCNDCHGSHGATPPGLASLAFVCGECHVREAQIFLQSGKYDALETHAEFIAGADSCADCHSEPDTAAGVTDVHGFLQCVVCHGQHGIVRPTVAMLAPLPETPCEFCHTEEEVPSAPARLLTGGRPEAYDQTRDQLLADAAELGLRGDDLFDWLVDRSREMAEHVGETEGARSFEDLMRRLRIGKTHFQVKDPETGETTRHAVVRCVRCHSDEPTLGPRNGLDYGGAYLGRMHAAASEAGLASQLILRARRGGVDTKDARERASAAVQALIDAQVLFHGFTLEEGGDLDQAFKTALDDADEAKSLGDAALAELAWRRRGLAGALFLVVLALIALAVKIRTLG